MTAAAEAGIEFEELLAALASVSPGSAERYQAMAQYLAGAEGWRDAKDVLRGNFSGFVAARLTGAQEE